MPPAKKPKVAADPKQTTLFKHISGVPPPKKEQPTLAGLWGKKATDPEPATEKGASLEEPGCRSPASGPLLMLMPLHRRCS
jgi:hypothetical protein